ncbi:MAG: hypothetical protein HQL54_01595 [Magnetococcales bacterium]|nr:hypothetical protein [Magnetococcales bacterium]
MNLRKSIRFAALIGALLLPQVGAASSGGAPLPKLDWDHKGVFGEFDNASLKRGAQIAVEVCMGCHSFKYIKFDALRQFGYTEAEVKEMAESQGKNKTDKMLSAMSKEDAIDSFNIVPPDLSLMTKARKGYENYVNAILTGYLTEEETALVEEAYEDEDLSEEEVKAIAKALHLDPHNAAYVKEVVLRIGMGSNFNKYFPGHFFAMPQPLMDEAVEYADGTQATLAQLSKDVVNFMSWTAEPTLMERKSLGIYVIIYLIIFTALLYALKRRIWAKIH